MEAALEQQHAGDPEALAVLEAERIEIEIELYRNNSDCFGYVFYVMRKPG